MGIQNWNGLQSNSYNSSRQYHPNFPWSDPNKSSLPSRPNYPPEYSQQEQQPPQTESPSDLENLLKAYIAKNDATLRNLGNQMGQLVNELRNRPQGALLCYIENPRIPSKENCKATLDPKVVEVKDGPIDKEEVQSRVQTLAPQNLNVENFDEVNPKIVNSDNLKPLLDVKTIPQKSCPVQAKVPPPSYLQRLKQ
ncbi:hypothetical protein EPI10_028194 [Gossypium australe]|uniref:Uncharacterized protein n=1 Tax=Gossypium australe TaxID=47621 RepID=A0A5B6UV63_9ROSI|nr:hypothetical protein EPI10_028194 [Gossypium australe]